MAAPMAEPDLAADGVRTISRSPFFDTWRDDVPAGIVVFLVALPLCLGIAVASGAPLISGVVAGVVGGLVVGALSGSSLMVSGPAAGLTPIVLLGIQQVGGFERLLPAVVLAGALQLLLSAARAGTVAYYVPSSVIKGMLAGIGITLILKQVPHAVGYDSDAEGDLSFIEPSGETTLSTLAAALQQIQVGAVIAALIGVAVMLWWPRSPFARIRLLPAPLMAVGAGVGLNELFQCLPPRARGARHAPGVVAHHRQRRHRAASRAPGLERAVEPGGVAARASSSRSSPASSRCSISRPRASSIRCAVTPR